MGIINKDSDKDKKSYKHQKTFCSALWMHLHVINDGRAFPCCMTPIEDEHSLGNVKAEPLLELMNSEKAKDMRKNMLKGNPLPDSCDRCVQREKSGFGSMRIGMNDQWYDTIEDLIDETEEDGTINEVRLKYWDFRFSNYCNFACRTCSPLFSSKWSKDYTKVYGENATNEHLGLINLDTAYMFWDELDEHIDEAQMMHFAGGEPVIMPEHWKLIETLNEKEHYDVFMKYSTNASKLSYKGEDMIKVWQKFNKVHLSLSIDGVGDVFNLVRHGGDWDVVKSNLERIRDAEIDYWIHPTISMLNIFRTTELHETLFNMNMIPNKPLPHQKNPYSVDHYFTSRFHINPVSYPDHYSIRVMPKELKDKARDQILEYGERMNKKHGIPMSGWESLIDFMYSQEYNENEFNEFVELTKDVDQVRNQNFLKLNPEFKPYF